MSDDVFENMINLIKTMFVKNNELSIQGMKILNVIGILDIK